MQVLECYPEVMEELIRRAEERFGIRMPRLKMRRPPSSVRRRLALSGGAGWTAEHPEDVLTKAHRLGRLTGDALRPMLHVLRMPRPTATVGLTASVDFFKIDDPMERLVPKATAQQRLRAALGRACTTLFVRGIMLYRCSFEMWG